MLRQLLMILFIGIFSLNIAFASDKNIITNIIPDEKGKLIIMTSEKRIEDYNTIRLKDPARVIVDIPNTVLSFKKMSIDIADKGIKSFKASQFSLNPDIVRFVFTADSQEYLDKLGLKVYNKTLVFKIDDINPKNIVTPKIYADKKPHKSKTVASKQTKKLVTITPFSDQTKQSSTTKANNIKNNDEILEKDVPNPDIKETLAPDKPGESCIKDDVKSATPNDNKILDEKTKELNKEESKAVKVSKDLLQKQMDNILEDEPDAKTEVTQEPKEKTKQKVAEEAKQETQQVLKQKNTPKKIVKEDEPPKCLIEDKKEQKKHEFSQKNIFYSVKNNNSYNLVIKKITTKKNQIVLSGTGNFIVFEPLLIKEPKRLVFDIPNSILDSSALAKTIELENKDVVRIGQFESNTARLVIETSNPDKYITAVTPDTQSMVISPEDELDFSVLKQTFSDAKIQDIKVYQIDKNITKIILSSNNPIYHNIKHKLDSKESSLALFNVGVPEQELLARFKETNHLKGLNIKELEKGTKWLFSTKEAVQFETRLSLDGRTLELTLKSPKIVKVAKKKTPKNNNNLLRGKIVIDAGHGGYDPGAEVNGIFEKDIVYDIAKRLAKKLQNAGVQTIFTRKGDKTVSLKERTNITNKEKPDAFVSIHINSSTDKKIKGIETHWYTNQSEGLAFQIQQELVKYVKSPDRGVKNSMFYVIHHTDVPAVLVEIGFMSNPSERYQLLSAKRKDQTAKAISAGLFKYLIMKYSAMNPIQVENKL